MMFVQRRDAGNVVHRQERRKAKGARSRRDRGEQQDVATQEDTARSLGWYIHRGGALADLSRLPGVIAALRTRNISPSDVRPRVEIGHAANGECVYIVTGKDVDMIGGGAAQTTDATILRLGGGALHPPSFVVVLQQGCVVDRAEPAPPADKDIWREPLRELAAAALRVKAEADERIHHEWFAQLRAMLYNAAETQLVEGEMEWVGTVIPLLVAHRRHAPNDVCRRHVDRVMLNITEHMQGVLAMRLCHGEHIPSSPASTHPPSPTATHAPPQQGSAILTLPAPVMQAGGGSSFTERGDAGAPRREEKVTWCVRSLLSVLAEETGQGDAREGEVLDAMAGVLAGRLLRDGGGAAPAAQPQRLDTTVARVDRSITTLATALKDAVDTLAPAAPAGAAATRGNQSQPSNQTSKSSSKSKAKGK